MICNKLSDSQISEPAENNKLAKLRRHASRVHFAKIHFGQLHFGKIHFGSKKLGDGGDLLGDGVDLLGDQLLCIFPFVPEILAAHPRWS